MRPEQKTNIQNSIGRLAFTGLSLLVQVLWIVFLGIKLTQYAAAVGVVSSVIAFLLSVWIFDRRDLNANFKTPWIIIIMAFPILGIFLFLFYGHKYSRRVRKNMDELHEKCLDNVVRDYVSEDSLEKIDHGIANQFRYLMRVEKFPLYTGNDVEFYSDAAPAYDEMIEAAKHAEKFIFLEYHAIEYSESFKRLEEVLTMKVREGVDVRILYDDVGSIGFINGKFARKMEEQGIKCRAFNRVSPSFRLFMNNRDHRKITVVDGEVAFTGGYNLADEYFNIKHPYGHWKDTGVKIVGPAVGSFLCMFLEMWNGTEKETEDLHYYNDLKYKRTNGEGYVLPYADSPLDESRVGENVYINIISNAKKYVYITTPYLVISDEMRRVLALAALRGVDVRIVVPGIPDKKVVYKLTKSYFHDLIQCGVKIYKYTPGFIHCKQFVSDGEIATVGTINLDYRSLFHHFENGVLLYNMKAVKDVEADMKELFHISERVSQDYGKQQKLMKRIQTTWLRFIAPLL